MLAYLYASRIAIATFAIAINNYVFLDGPPSELDFCEKGDGSEMQSALHEWTGQRTVPNVFIGGKHIGGCDSTTDMHKGGKLIPLLTEAKAIATKSS